MTKNLMRVVCLYAALCVSAIAQQYKEGEYELYAEVTKQYAAGDFAKALAALDAWSIKVPQTDYLNNRRILYVQTYFAARQPAKAIEAAAELLAFKNHRGHFVKRRCLRALAALRRGGHLLGDDLAIAGVWFGSE